jgi:hypothetical protein
MGGKGMYSLARRCDPVDGSSLTVDSQPWLHLEQDNPTPAAFQAKAFWGRLRGRNFPSSADLIRRPLYAFFQYRSRRWIRIISCI